MERYIVDYYVGDVCYTESVMARDEKDARNKIMKSYIDSGEQGKLFIESITKE